MEKNNADDFVSDFASHVTLCSNEPSIYSSRHISNKIKIIIKNIIWWPYHILNPAKVIYLNFQPLEVVSRYRDPQPKVVENYPHLRSKIYKSWCSSTHFIINMSDYFDRWINQITNDRSRD